MTRPTELNYVTCEFGRPGGWAAGYHTGIDYRAPVGTEIYATRRGRTYFVGWDGSYGHYVVIKSWHRFRFIRHYYCHLSEPLVRKGQRVVTGQVIAKSGNTGNSTGPHLHYEERISPYGYYDHQHPALPGWQPKKPKILKNILRRVGVLRKK